MGFKITTLGLHESQRDDRGAVTDQRSASWATVANPIRSLIKSTDIGSNLFHDRRAMARKLRQYIKPDTRLGNTDNDDTTNQWITFASTITHHTDTTDRPYLHK